MNNLERLRKFTGLSAWKNVGPEWRLADGEERYTLVGDCDIFVALMAIHNPDEAEGHVWALEAKVDGVEILYRSSFDLEGACDVFMEDWMEIAKAISALTPPKTDSEEEGR